jgi:hypothetical protein
MEPLSGYPVLVAHRDLSDVCIGAALLDPELFGGEAELVEALDAIHSRGEGIPVLLLVRRGELEQLPLALSQRTGIALMVPGERFAAGSAATAYLKPFEECDNRFPGFERELQGIFPRSREDGRIQYRTYVVGEPLLRGG